MGIFRAQKVNRKTTNRKQHNLKKLVDNECQRMLKAKGASSFRYVASEGVEEKWEGIKTTIQDNCEIKLRLENNKQRADI
jgi:hypothetical protein